MAICCPPDRLNHTIRTPAPPTSQTILVVSSAVTYFSSLFNFLFPSPHNTTHPEPLHSPQPTSNRLALVPSSYNINLLFTPSSRPSPSSLSYTILYPHSTATPHYHTTPHQQSTSRSVRPQHQIIQPLLFSHHNIHPLPHQTNPLISPKNLNHATPRKR